MSFRVEALCDGVWYNPYSEWVDPFVDPSTQNVHPTQESAETAMEKLRFSSQEWERTLLRVVEFTQ